MNILLWVLLILAALRWNPSLAVTAAGGPRYGRRRRAEARRSSKNLMTAGSFMKS